MSVGIAITQCSIFISGSQYSALLHLPLYYCDLAYAPKHSRSSIETFTLCAYIIKNKGIEYYLAHVLNLIFQFIDNQLPQLHLLMENSKCQVYMILILLKKKNAITGIFSYHLFTSYGNLKQTNRFICALISRERRSIKLIFELKIENAKLK